MTIIESWHNLTSLAELNKAVEQLNEWAAANKVAPDTIYFTVGHCGSPGKDITLVETTLTDGSKIYDLAVAY